MNAVDPNAGATRGPNAVGPNTGPQPVIPFTQMSPEQPESPRWAHTPHAGGEAVNSRTQTPRQGLLNPRESNP